MLFVTISIIVACCLAVAFVVYHYRDEPPLFHSPEDTLPAYELPLFFVTPESIIEPPPAYTPEQPSPRTSSVVS
jgi:hypothetical protein